jgi:hypothetical protein
MEGTAEKVIRPTGLSGPKTTFGKTWGMKPKVAYWILTMTSRPILTYGSTVWWPRVICKVSWMELVSSGY